MKTKVILQDRGTGKTTRAIQESAKTGRYILVPRESMAHHVFQKSKEMGLEIPFPITLADIHRRDSISNVIANHGIIIDEGLMVLKKLLNIPIHMITMSDEMPEDNSFWIARDKDRKLNIFNAKPIRHQYEWMFSKCSGEFHSLPTTLFPDLIWEDEPIEVDSNLVEVAE